MAKIAVLRTQIINYSKIREICTVWKNGYSKRFLTEHGAEFLLDKAAKKAFGELGIEKLSGV